MLVNPLGPLALDASVQALVTAIGGLQAALADMDHMSFVTQARALQYARALDDSMRVTVQSLPAVTVVGGTAYWGNTNTYPLWYSTGAPGSMDAREQQRELSDQTFRLTRNRWTIT